MESEWRLVIRAVSFLCVNTINHAKISIISAIYGACTATIPDVATHGSSPSEFSVLEGETWHNVWTKK